MLVLGVGVVVFALLGAGVVWVRASRAHARPAAPVPPAAAAPVPTPSAESIDTTGTVLGASPEPIETTPVTSAPKPARSTHGSGAKPRAHGGPRPPSSAPPSPTDVPEGRL